MNDTIIVFSFTRSGTELNRKICGMFRNAGMQCYGYAFSKYASYDVLPAPSDLCTFVGENWGRSKFVFIGAAGIAIRMIAPWVKDKFTDSAVLVIDEKGEFVIPLLSGHVGGAAAMADILSEMLEAVPVHTTATDVRGLFAVDFFAVANHLYITDRAAAKAISAAVLEGEKIGLFVNCEFCKIEDSLPEEVVLCYSREELKKFRHSVVIADKNASTDPGSLLLLPRNITAGVGCRKEIGTNTFETGLKRVLERNGICEEQLELITSIELKKNETAILEFSKKYGIPFIVYASDELKKCKTVSSGSEFVKKTVGVDNVCERAAVISCPEGKVIQEKCIEESMTVALARRVLPLRFGK